MHGAAVWGVYRRPALGQGRLPADRFTARMFRFTKPIINVKDLAYKRPVTGEIGGAEWLDCGVFRPVFSSTIRLSS
jgi:hypothetical protein